MVKSSEYSKYCLFYRGRPNIRYSTRTRGGSSITRTPSQPTPAFSSRDQQLQNTWSEALDTRDIERLVVGPIMEDILQEALEWTIPEVVVEAEQEMREERAALQRAVLQHASTLIESVMSGSEEAQSLAVSLSSSTDIPQPSEPVEASAPPGAKGTSTVSAPITVYQDITPVHSEESAMEVQVQVEGVPQEAGEGTIKDSEEERLKDPFIQGTIAPKLTTVEQQKLHQDGIYLIIATKVADNLFVTQLAHDTLTLKQQAEIRQKEGEILITHNADDYEAAHMNLDPQWLEEQIKLQNE